MIYYFAILTAYIVCIDRRFYFSESLSIINKFVFNKAYNALKIKVFFQRRHTIFIVS